MGIVKGNIRWWVVVCLVATVAVVSRFYRLDSLPPSLYWEEVALGYDAWSLWQTGRDHHGHPWPVVALESFGDWKPVGYVYALIPSVAVFGLNAWSVRLPAAIGGLLTIGGAAEWSQLLWPTTESRKKWIGLAVAGIGAISPWSLFFSRAAWEVSLATAFLVWGSYCAWRAIDDQPSTSKTSPTHRQEINLGWLWLAVGLGICAMYTYHATRLITPLLGMWIIGWRTRHWWRRSSWEQGLINLIKLGLAGLLAMALGWPLVTQFNSPIIKQRFAETSIFQRLDVIIESNQLREAANYAWWSRLIYHRYWLFTKLIAGNLLSHLDGNYLLVTGDANHRHSAGYFGILYPLDLILLILGGGWWWRHQRSNLIFLSGWLIIGLLPAALTTAVPHALRTLSVLPVYLIILGTGLMESIFLAKKFGRQMARWWPLSRWGKTGNWSVVMMVIWVSSYFGQFIIFGYFYQKIYPRLYSHDWQFGYQEMVTNLRSLTTQYPNTPVYISRFAGRPAMYYWFFNQTNPRLVQAANDTVKKDQGEFLEFDRIRFINSPSEIINQSAIVAMNPGEIDWLRHQNFQLSDTVTVTDPSHQPVWVTAKISQ